MNRNNIAIAPTYTNNSKIPKKSTLNNINIIAVFMKIDIKKKTEYIGLFDNIIRIAEINNKIYNIKVKLITIIKKSY